MEIPWEIPKQGSICQYLAKYSNHPISQKEKKPLWFLNSSLDIASMFLIMRYPLVPKPGNKMQLISHSTQYTSSSKTSQLQPAIPHQSSEVSYQK